MLFVRLCFYDITTKTTVIKTYVIVWPANWFAWTWLRLKEEKCIFLTMPTFNRWRYVFCDLNSKFGYFQITLCIWARIGVEEGECGVCPDLALNGRDIVWQRHSIANTGKDAYNNFSRHVHRRTEDEIKRKVERWLQYMRFVCICNGWFFCLYHLRFIPSRTFSHPFSSCGLCQCDRAILSMIVCNYC